MRDPLYSLPLDQQRYYVARCMGLHPDWAKEGKWEGTIDALLNVRRREGHRSFLCEIGRMMSPDP